MREAVLLALAQQQGTVRVPIASSRWGRTRLAAGTLGSCQLACRPVRQKKSQARFPNPEECPEALRPPRRAAALPSPAHSGWPPGQICGASPANRKAFWCVAARVASSFIEKTTRNKRKGCALLDSKGRPCPQKNNPPVLPCSCRSLNQKAARLLLTSWPIFHLGPRKKEKTKSTTQKIGLRVASLVPLQIFGHGRSGALSRLSDSLALESKA